MSLERIRLPEEVRHWHGDMICDYTYTLGVAGEKFYSGLKEGRIIGSKCPECGRIFVPPSAYCPFCFTELTEWVEVPDEGFVYALTVAHVDADGEPLEEPELYAFIVLERPGEAQEIYGGILHKLGEVGPEEAYIGMRVKAVWAPPEERKGTLADIRYFRPIE